MHHHDIAKPNDKPTEGRVSISKRAVYLSIVVIWLLGTAIFSLNLLVENGSIVRSDGLAYYMYARSLVLDLDVDLTEDYTELDALFPAPKLITAAVKRYARLNPETGRIGFPWPAGSGAVMAPFYALGYVVELVAAAIVARAPNSYGVIPQYFYGLGSVLYGLLGFWGTFLCIRHIASNETAWLSTLGILLASPVVFYVFFSPSMAHASSFGLVSLLTLLWWRSWHGGTQNMAFLGALLGILITIRYQNALFGILLVALVVRDFQRTSFHTAFFRALAGASAAAIPVTLEGFHYVATHGLLFGNSEGDLFRIGGFWSIDLSSPNFVQVLISCDKGAFYWTPILALGVTGLVWAARKESWAQVLLITIIAHIYLIGAILRVDIENKLGGSFGMRYLSECAPFFALGLAVLLHDTAKMIRIIWWRLVLGLFVVWNGLLILAYVLTISRYECVTFPQMVHGIIQAIVKVLMSDFV